MKYKKKPGLYMAVYGRSAGKARRVVGKSRCPKCGRNSLVREKDGWKGAKTRVVCAYVGCLWMDDK